MYTFFHFVINIVLVLYNFSKIIKLRQSSIGSNKKKFVTFLCETEVQHYIQSVDRKIVNNEILFGKFRKLVCSYQFWFDVFELHIPISIQYYDILAL